MAGYAKRFRAAINKTGEGLAEIEDLLDDKEFREDYPQAAEYLKEKYGEIDAIWAGGFDDAIEWIADETYYDDDLMERLEDEGMV